MGCCAGGTFDWAALELLAGQRHTSKVDMYSFGVVLWEIATGERPRRGRMREPHVPQECPKGAGIVGNNAVLAPLLL